MIDLATMDLPHIYGLLMAEMVIINVCGIFLLAIGHLCGLRRYERIGSLVYLSAKYAFQSIFWPIGTFFAFSDAILGRDLFADMIRYDGSW